MTKLPITNIFRTDLKAAKSVGLFDPMESPSAYVLKTKLQEYNDSLIDEPEKQPIEDEPIEYTTIYKADVETARQALINRSIEPVEPTALERAMAVIQDPALSAALQAQFDAQGKKPARVKKEPVDKSVRLAALIDKHRVIYDKVQQLIHSSGLRKNQAQMTVALEFDTSQGAIGFYVTAYHMYAKYPEIKDAVDKGLYPLSTLCKDATKADRSAVISEKLGIDMVITLD